MPGVRREQAPVETEQIPPAKAPRRVWLPRALYGMALTALFALALWAGLWGNGFPSAWHNDEPGKIQQVRQGSRNFHHPPLMLDVVALLAEVTGAKSDPEAVARLGRDFSAVCLALAAVGLALLGARLAGPVAGLVAGAALGSHPLLVECAHYFKEDSLHLLGLVAALWAGQIFWEHPRSRRCAVAFGMALGLCAAAKHSGWLMILVMAGVSGWLQFRLPLEGGPPGPPSGRRRVLSTGTTDGDVRPPGKRWRMVLGVFAVTYLVMCWPMFQQLPLALGEILWEMRKLGGGDYGMGLKTPHPLYLWLIYNDYGWTGSLLLAALLVVGLVQLVKLTRPRDWAVMVMAAYTLVYLVALAFTAKFSDRYGLPLVLGASLALGLGAARMGPWLARFFHRGEPAPEVRAAKGGRLRSFIVHRLTPAMSLLVVLVVFAPGRVHDLRERLTGFATDSHEDLARFIRNHTPPGSVIAADAMALSPKAAVGSRRAVIGSWFAADLGTLEELSERGVRYVAFSRDVAHRYYETDWARATYFGDPASQTPRPLDLHRVKFYSELAQAGSEAGGSPAALRVRLVWNAPYRDPRPLHPGLFLVELIPPTPDAVPKTPRALTTSE